MKIKQQISSTAMVFAAGFGKRLGQLTVNVPKPLLDIGGTNCLRLAIHSLKKAGIQKIIVNTHHMSEKIHNYLSAESNVQCVFEPKILETGGGILNVLEKFEGKSFLTVNGDIFWQGDSLLSSMISYWQPEIMDGLLAIVHKKNTMAYHGKGDFFLNLDGKIIQRGQIDSAPYIYMGIQILKSDIWDSYSKNQPFPLVDLYCRLSQQGRLFGLEQKVTWIDIGTMEGLNKAREIYQS